MTEPTLFPDITTRAERREASRNPHPEFTFQSMGAGVQSTKTYRHPIAIPAFDDDEWALF